MNLLHRYRAVQAGLFCGLMTGAQPALPDADRVLPEPSISVTGAADRRAEVVTVRPDADVMTKQGVPQFVGISAETAGSKGLSMNLVVIPPGAAAKPHLHRGFESAIYLIEGRVETRYGPGLKKSVVNHAGDFLFIPPNVPHQPRNLSDTEPARAIVSRNDPSDQENVVPYDPSAHD